MKYSNIFGAAFIPAVIAWGGFSAARLLQSKPDASLSAARPDAVMGAPAASAPSVSGPVVEFTDNAAPPDAVLAGPAAPGDEPQPEVSTVGAVEYEPLELMPGVQQGTIQSTMRGNGRERMIVKLRNNSPSPVRVTIPAGQLLESGRNNVVVTRAAVVELMPARSVDIHLSTAALHSSNVIGESLYRPSYRTAERLEGFLLWASLCGEISAAAKQTAILALTENLPLSAFAKFSSSNAAPSQHNTDAFRVETADILGALTALRESGVKLEIIAMASDPQLRIESMIEPMSREAAKRYFGITEEREWEFWKRELLEGNPTTRHYALYGIARFYPDVALEMLPKWAREMQTHPVYRLAAVQALADTQRAEALPILRQLATEVGQKTELGKAATQAADYLDKRLTEIASRAQVVAFRDKSRVDGL